MKMCDMCYTLFDGIEYDGDCPIYKCPGDLVEIDSEIAELISLLNKCLKENDILLRTQFTCSGHFELYKDFVSFPYLGLCLIDDDTFLEGEGIKYCTSFKKDVLDELVKKMNEKIKSIKDIVVMTPYTAEFNILPFHFDDGSEGEEYRIFVNHLALDLNNLNSDTAKIRVLSKVQLYFKEFLCELIDKLSVADTDEEKK